MPKPRTDYAVGARAAAACLRGRLARSAGRAIRVLCVALCVAALGDVRNGGFEAGTEDWTTSTAVAAKPDEGREGSACVALTGPDAQLMQSVAREGDDRLAAVVGWFRSRDAIGSGPRLELLPLDAGGRRLGAPTVVMADGGTTEWHRVQLVGLLPFGTSAVELRVFGPSAGQAFADDLSVIQGSRRIREFLVDSQKDLIPKQTAKRAPCYRAPNPIVPDGDLSDWAHVPADLALRVGGGEWYGAASDYGGVRDSSMLFYVLWDENALYFAALVADDMAAALDGHEPDDETVVVIMYVDEKLRTGYDLLCYFPINELGPTRCRRLPLGRDSAGRAAVAQRDGHLVLEAEFPLTELVAARDASNTPFDPLKTAALRFDAGLYDSDTVKREHKPIWNTRVSWNQPASLGWLDFKNTPPPWHADAEPVGALWPEDVVTPFRPPAPCPRLGLGEQDAGNAEMAPGLGAAEVQRLIEQVRNDPDYAKTLAALVATYKYSWRPQTCLGSRADQSVADRRRAARIARRLLQAYLAFDDGAAGILWQETTQALQAGESEP